MTPIPKAGSELEAELAQAIRALKLPTPEREYVFHSERKWRLDFAWPDERLAAEVEGGTWAQGRHTRASGFRSDCRKYNSAVLLGWRVLRFDGDMVKSGEALAVLVEALQ